MKKIIYIINGIAIVLLLFIVVNFFCYNTKSEYTITDKETAIEIGRVLLEKHYPDFFANGDIVLDAEETKDTWMVYNVIERTGTTEDGMYFVVMDGGVHAKFRKDGKILEIAMAG